MVGPGTYGAELRNIASALAISLTLIPGVEHNQTPRYLSLADIFILPTWHTEGLPFTLVEAMFCKRPIIASDIGGVSEIVRPEQTGLLTPPRNPAALAAAIHRLLTDKLTRTRLGHSGYALANAMFSLDAMTNRFEQVLNQMCDRPVRRRAARVRISAFKAVATRPRQARAA
jgi:glycosyltransferase involved in cell wall biosynthesis